MNEGNRVLSCWSCIALFIYLIFLHAFCDSHWELWDILSVYIQWKCDRTEYARRTRAHQRHHGILQQQWVLFFPLLHHTSILHSRALDFPERWRPPAPRHQVYHSSECLISVIVIVIYVKENWGCIVAAITFFILYLCLASLLPFSYDNFHVTAF